MVNVTVYFPHSAIFNTLIIFNTIFESSDDQHAAPLIDSIEQFSYAFLQRELPNQ